MRGEEREVVRDHAFHTLLVHGDEPEAAAFNLCLLPSYRGQSWCWSEQFLRDCSTPFFEQIKTAIRISRRRERGAVADAPLLSRPESVVPVDTRPPIIGEALGTPPRIAAAVAQSGVLAVSVAGGGSSGFPRRRSCLGARAGATKFAT